VCSNTLPVFAGDRDGALRDALGLIAPRPLLERAARGEGSLTAIDDEAAEPTVTAVHRVAAEPARFAPFPESLDERLVRAYASRGVTQLYTHQAEAAGHVLAGRNVVVVTPTASGKTLCYNLPVLHTILQAPSTRALYLFPTKALAQDQLAELHGLAEAIEDEAGVALGAFTYDGDTPQDARRAIRQSAHIALTNPDTACHPPGRAAGARAARGSSGRRVGRRAGRPRRPPVRGSAPRRSAGGAAAGPPVPAVSLPSTAASTGRGRAVPARECPRSPTRQRPAGSSRQSRGRSAPRAGIAPRAATAARR